MILVETDRKGFRASKLLGKMGVRASDTSQLSFDDVKVPEENLVGTVEGNGFHQLMDTFNHTRIAVAAQGVGVAQGAFEKAIRYTGTREQFGQPISSFQATQLKIAEMATLIEAGRGLYYRSAWLLDRGKVKPELISMAKWFCAEAGVRVTGEALLMHGGYGYFEEYDVERFYRAAKLTEIVEGTKDIEKLIVARHLLKKMQG
jgi:acyl-CoA dehydrogenase